MLVLIVGTLIASRTVAREAQGTPAIVAFFVVTIAAWHGGLGPGLLATALAAFLPP